ncbi:hypothetical protein BSY16_6112 (plasmid) [Sinorhizobium sp. RAC02]|nr:hypothetical protein BSY16_6112 [Sinorhizobium sp. RAC02]
MRPLFSTFMAAATAAADNFNAWLFGPGEADLRPGRR